MLIIGLNQSVAWDVLKGEDSVADPLEITHFGDTCLPLDTKYLESELNRTVPSSTPQERTRSNRWVRTYNT
jgi:hypothetical protein